MNLRDLKVGDKFLPEGTSHTHSWDDQPLPFDSQMKVKVDRMKEYGGGSYMTESVFCFCHHIENSGIDFEWLFEVTKINKKTMNIKWMCINNTYHKESDSHTYDLVEYTGKVDLDQVIMTPMKLKINLK